MGDFALNYHRGIWLEIHEPHWGLALSPLFFRAELFFLFPISVWVLWLHFVSEPKSWYYPQMVEPGTLFYYLKKCAQEYGWERSSNRHSCGGRWTCKGENNILCNVRAEGVSPDGLAREKTTFCDNVHEQKACCHLMTSTSARHRHTETAVTQKLKLPNLMHRQKAQMAKPTLAHTTS